MNYDENIIKEVESLAGLFLTPEEISVLLDIDRTEFDRQIRMKSGILYKTYMFGKTQSKKEIHVNVIKMAKHGSPLAEDMAQKMIISQDSYERSIK